MLIRNVITGSCAFVMATQNNFKAFYTVQKMKFSIKDFFSKSEHVTKSAGNCGIWSRLLKKSLMENFIFVKCYHGYTEAYLGSSQTSIIELICENSGFYTSTIFAKSSILDVWQSPKQAFAYKWFNWIIMKYNWKNIWKLKLLWETRKVTLTFKKVI